LRVGWETRWQHKYLKPSLGLLRDGLASRSGECHSSHRRKSAQAHQTAFRCWECGGGSRDRRGRLGNTPPFPPPRPTAAPQWVGVSPAGSRSARVQPARRGERRSSGRGAGRAWWLWEWLGRLEQLQKVSKSTSLSPTKLIRQIEGELAKHSEFSEKQHPSLHLAPRDWQKEKKPRSQKKARKYPRHQSHNSHYCNIQS